MESMKLEFIGCDICGSNDNNVLFSAKDYRYGYMERFSFVKCSSCGLIYLNPRPTQDAIVKLYEAYYTPENEQGALPAVTTKTWQSLMVRFGRKIIGSYTDEITDYAGDKVLDIGCGNGYQLYSLRQRGCNVFGIEVNQNSVSRCHKLGLDVFHGSLAEANFPDSFFDTIIFSQVLEHLPSPKKTLKEAYRILKPEGKVFIYMPNPEGYLAKIFGKYWHGWHIPFHFYMLKEEMMQKLAKESGFTVEKIRTVTPERFFTVSLKGYLWGEKNGKKEFVKRGKILDFSLFVIAISLVLRVLDFVMPRSGDCLKIIIAKNDRCEAHQVLERIWGNKTINVKKSNSDNKFMCIFRFKMGREISSYAFWFFVKSWYYAMEFVPRYLRYIYLAAAGVRFGKGLKLYGLPMINLHPGSQIRLGDRVILRSTSCGNSLGVNHRVILRTQREGAIIEIGNRVGISGGAICARKRVSIGDDVLIGSNVVIADNDFHPIDYNARKDMNDDAIEVKDVIISNGVWIGADVYVCKGVTIGEHSVIGARSVVTRSIPANCVAAGIPAKIVRFL